MFWISENQLFSGGFGFAVTMQRIRRVLLSVISPATIKDQIGGKENEWDFRRQFCKLPGDFDIYASCMIRIFLSVRNGADGRAVDDELRLVFCKLAADGSKIEEVKIGARDCPHTPVCGKARRGLDEIITNQSVCAGDPNELKILRFKHTEFANHHSCERL